MGFQRNRMGFQRSRMGVRHSRMGVEHIRMGAQRGGMGSLRGVTTFTLGLCHLIWKWAHIWDSFEDLPTTENYSLSKFYVSSTC